MSFKIASCLLLSGFLSGCDSTDNRRVCNKQEANALQKAVLNNYSRNEEVFQSLQQFFKFQHVRRLSVKDSAVFSIDYKVEDNNKERWTKVEVNPKATLVDSVLVQEGFTKGFLDTLSTELTRINASSIWVIDNYDQFKGKAFKEIEISYADITCTRKYRYRIFDKPLRAMDKSFMAFPDNASGAIVLSENTFCYYTYR